MAELPAAVSQMTVHQRVKMEQSALFGPETKDHFLLQERRMNNGKVVHKGGRKQCF